MFVGLGCVVLVGGGFVGCGVLVGGMGVVLRSGWLVNVIKGCVAVGVGNKVDVPLGVITPSSVIVGFGVSDGCKEAVIVNEAVGLKNICANACLVCTWAVLIVGLGEIVTSKISLECVSLTLPPDTSMGIPKLTPATIKMTTNKTMDLGFILQAFPVLRNAKVLQGLSC